MIYDLFTWIADLSLSLWHSLSLSVCDCNCDCVIFRALFTIVFHTACKLCLRWRSQSSQVVSVGVRWPTNYLSLSLSLSIAVSISVYLLCYGRCNEPSKLAFNPLLSQLCWPLRVKCKLQTEFCLRLLWLFMKPIVDRVKIYFYGHFYTHRNVQEMHCGKKWATIELGYKPH